MNINCKALILVFKDSGETDAGKADVIIDGSHILTVDPHKNGWIHCNSVIILNEQTSREHQVCLRIAEGDDNKKFTILAFGYVE